LSEIATLFVIVIIVIIIVIYCYYYYYYYHVSECLVVWVCLSV